MNGSTAEDLALERRDSLPDALRVLLQQYPREAWETHPEFSALIRFWLERHLMFRRMQRLLREETQGFLGAAREPDAYGRGLVRVAGAFINELHGHHMIEDLHYFPTLQGLDARISSGFELLDADHKAIDPALCELADRTNAVLDAVRSGSTAVDAAGALDERLARMERLLDRHLTDEEELVVPVLLAHPEASLG